MTPDARKLDALFAEVYAHPADDAPRLVLADLLQQDGDPRGELIALQCRPPTPAGDLRIATLLRKHAMSWLGPVSSAIRTERVRDRRGRWQFRRGFLAVATVEAGHVETPAWATLDELFFATNQMAETMRPVRALRSPPLAALLDGGPWGAEELEIDVPDLDVGDGLAATDRLPHLTRLWVANHVGWIPRARFAPQLRLLGLDARTPAMLAEMLVAPLPALETLVVGVTAFSAPRSAWSYENQLVLTRDAAGAFTIGRLVHTAGSFEARLFAQELARVLATVPLTRLEVTSIGQVSPEVQRTLETTARAAGIATLDLSAVGGEITGQATTLRARKARAPQIPIQTVTQLAFQGDDLFAGTSRGVVVIDAATFTPRALWETEDRVEALAASPERVAVSSGSTIRTFDRKTGERLDRRSYEPSTVCGIAFAPDGKRYAYGTQNKKVILVDAKGDAAPPLILHASYVTAVAWSADATLLATASLDHTGRIVDIAKRRTLKKLVGHSDPVRSVAFSPDDRRIVTTSYDGTVRLWTRAGVEIACHERADHGSQAARFSRAGPLVVAWNDGDVTLHDPDSLEPVARIPVEPDLRLEDLAIAPDGKHAVVSFDAGLAVIALDHGKVIKRLP